MKKIKVELRIRTGITRAQQESHNGRFGVSCVQEDAVRYNYEAGQHEAMLSNTGAYCVQQDVCAVLYPKPLACSV